jgi:hypothetical protein
MNIYRDRACVASNHVVLSVSILNGAKVTMLRELLKAAHYL